MRFPHFLRPNRNNATPSNVIIMDTETKSTEIEPGVSHAQLWFGWAEFSRRHRGDKWTPSEWFRFDDTEVFWEWVESKCKPRRKVYVIAHNLGFDATITKAVAVLQANGWDLKGAILEDPPTVLRYRKGDLSLVLMDSLNIFRLSLAQVGAFIGSDKTPMPDLGASREDWDAYCRQDVRVLSMALRLYWSQVKEWDLGNFQYTLPSQAFTAFRHRFMDHPVFIDDNEESHNLSRRAYSGGRVECFRLGRLPGRVHCLDINSQYPYIMANRAVPTRLVTVFKPKTLGALAEQMEDRAVVAEVSVQSYARNIPLKLDDRLLFPVGRFDTVLATPELREPLERGAIKSVGRVAVYETARLFREYVDYFWGQRQKARAEGNKSLEWMCKLFLNSLYGKFGQTGRVFETLSENGNPEVKVWTEWDVDRQELNKYRQLGGLVQLETRSGESRDSFPAIAAHITAEARSYLWGMILCAGIENVYYCDTDSLFVNDLGLERLRPDIAEGTLGSLKLEWSSSNVTIHGPKDYVVDGTAKIKGIRKNAEVLGPGHYRQDVFRGFRGMLRAGDLDRMLITKTEKTLAREYTKGTVLPTGQVLPLEFPLHQGLRGTSRGRPS